MQPRSHGIFLYLGKGKSHENEVASHDVKFSLINLNLHKVIEFNFPLCFALLFFPPLTRVWSSLSLGEERELISRAVAVVKPMNYL